MRHLDHHELRRERRKGGGNGYKPSACNSRPKVMPSANSMAIWASVRIEDRRRHSSRQKPNHDPGKGGLRKITKAANAGIAESAKPIS